MAWQGSRVTKRCFGDMKLEPVFIPLVVFRNWYSIDSLDQISSCYGIAIKRLGPPGNPWYSKPCILGSTYHRLVTLDFRYNLGGHFCNTGNPKISLENSEFCVIQHTQVAQVRFFLRKGAYLHRSLYYLGAYECVHPRLCNIRHLIGDDSIFV